jgi:hypothetical protein
VVVRCGADALLRTVHNVALVAAETCLTVARALVMADLRDLMRWTRRLAVPRSESTFQAEKVWAYW